MELDPAVLLENRAASGDVEALLALAQRYDSEGMPGKAREWLRRGAELGHPGAKAAYGRNLISREPYEALQGVEWTRAAADEGDAEAAHLMAVLSAAGLGMTQNRVRSLDYLQASAERGGGMARAGLAALAGRWDLACDSAALETCAPDTWGKLRDAVDFKRWLEAPPPRAISFTPRIFSCEGFLSPEICDWLIEKSRPQLARAQTFSNRTGELGYDEGRSNSAVQIGLLRSDMVLTMVRAKIAAYIAIPNILLEDSSVLHYAAGQEYLSHVDYFDPRLPGTAREIAQRGQRVLTFLVYLNEDFEGGDTYFPRITQGFKMKKGGALMFWNVLPDLAPDPMSLHAGRTPSRGEKWLFSQWVRFRGS